jgi:hypothetical protein
VSEHEEEDEMAERKWLATGLVAGSIGLGALVGASLFAPGFGVAQTGSTEDSSTAEATVATDGWCFGDGEGPVAVAAEAIGIPPGDLLYAMRDGSTIAEVAEAEGVNVQTVVDALVASMQERLDAAVEDGFISQELADELSTGLEDRATAIVNGAFPFFHGGPMGGHGPWGAGPWGAGSFVDGATDAEAASVGLF